MSLIYEFILTKVERMKNTNEEIERLHECIDLFLKKAATEEKKIPPSLKKIEEDLIFLEKTFFETKKIKKKVKRGISFLRIFSLLSPLGKEQFKEIKKEWKKWLIHLKNSSSYLENIIPKLKKKYSMKKKETLCKS